MRIQRSSFFFDPAVFPDVIRMAAQPVAESEMPPKLRRILRADIQVMFPQMRLSFVAECFPAFDAYVSLVKLSGLFKGFDHFAEHIFFFYHCVDIYDRFRGKSGNGSAAHMFDTER